MAEKLVKLIKNRLLLCSLFFVLFAQANNSAQAISPQAPDKSLNVILNHCSLPGFKGKSGIDFISLPDALPPQKKQENEEEDPGKENEENEEKEDKEEKEEKEEKEKEEKEENDRKEGDPLSEAFSGSVRPSLLSTTNNYCICPPWEHYLSRVPLYLLFHSWKHFYN
jgi:hypothetical protein